MTALDFTSTRLLTLLNVSALRNGKRKRDYEDSEQKTEEPRPKLNKRRSVNFSPNPEVQEFVADTPLRDDSQKTEPSAKNAKEVAPEEDEDETGPTGGDKDPYEVRFGPNSEDLSASARESVDGRRWNTSRDQRGKLGLVVNMTPLGSNVHRTSQPVLLERLREPFAARQAKQSKDVRDLQNDWLSTLATNSDVFATALPLEARRPVREAISLHALNHITKKRRRVLKNNERLAHATKSDTSPPEDVQDQGFTRPSVLILCPFRNHALAWINALTSHTPTTLGYQVENHSRFLKEFALPEGAVDKLASAEPGAYPKDHIEMFKGNVDDNFRIGVKMTRKSAKLFAEFYGCDVVLASPLGLRMSIEKEKNGDFLSSIECMVVDSVDALTMQNWDHVKFVFSSLNKMPKESHDADFSRIKPWYLDGHAEYLRQTIILSSYETPEMRSLFNNSLKNVAGKMRTEKRWTPVSVPQGVDLNFIPFDCTSLKQEPDKRFAHFTTQILPSMLKSAVQSVNTVIFVPSSFDFIRLHNYFRKHAEVSFAVLSEYSTNQEISRARQAFFTGAKSFLLVSERFHFFRRYKIRGIRNLVFYGPPNHPQFCTELLSYPFLDDGVDSSDVTCRLLYCKYDWMRLERIAGTEGASDLVKRLG